MVRTYRLRRPFVIVHEGGLPGVTYPLFHLNYSLPDIKLPAPTCVDHPTAQAIIDYRQQVIPSISNPPAVDMPGVAWNWNF